MAVILCYGDSNTHGTLPMADLSDMRRLSRQERWPGVMAAALPGHEVIEEGLPGRTTLHDDPVEGADRNGMTGLAIALGSHLPVDLVTIMLGTNDLKPRFSVPAFDIALSVEKLVLAVQGSIAGPGGAAPRVLLIAPPPILEVGELGEIFAGGATKSVRFGPLYAAVAARRGCGFLDAGRVIASSPIDGIHFDAAAHHALGVAVAEAVRGML